MKTLLIREKLYDFIRVADDKKVKAIYMMLEDEIIEELEWWKNKQITADLDKRYSNYMSGKEQPISLEELESKISIMKQKRNEK